MIPRLDGKASLTPQKTSATTTPQVNWSSSPVMSSCIASRSAVGWPFKKSAQAEVSTRTLTSALAAACGAGQGHLATRSCLRAPGALEAAVCVRTR